MTKRIHGGKTVEKIPVQKGKSHFQAWLKASGLGVAHAESALRDGRDGWYDLAVYILAEAVMTAAQQEDAQAAQEACDWLLSRAAARLFEDCNLEYRSVNAWIKRGCPLPDARAITPFNAAEEVGGLTCPGLLYGSLTLREYNRLPARPLDEILGDAGWRFDDPY